VIKAEHFGQVLTGIGQSTIDRILASAVSGGAINGPHTVAREPDQYVQNLPGSHTSMGHLMGHLEALMISEMSGGTSPVRQSACSRAEARGFEPRMGANPNRISSPFAAAKVTPS
jgi:hypothetical protein